MYPVTIADMADFFRLGSGFVDVTRVDLHPDDLGTSPTWTIGLDGVQVGTVSDDDDTRYLVTWHGQGAPTHTVSLVVGSEAAKKRWWQAYYERARVREAAAIARLEAALRSRMAPHECGPAWGAPFGGGR